MIPKNDELFADLSDVERLFIEPDEHPWEALRRMLKFMRDCAGEREPECSRESVREWPDGLLCFKDYDHDARTPSSYISIDRSAHVRGGLGLKSDQSVYIKGPVVFGKNVTLRKGAVVTGPSFIGDRVLIGQGCRIKNSIVRAGTEVQFGTRVAHAILGRDVFIGANAVLSDRPLDGGPVSYEIPYEGGMGADVCHAQRYETRFEELGLVAGDGVRIGGGAVFVPGVILLKQAHIEEGAHVLRRDVYSGALHSQYVGRTSQ